jgi:glutamate-1-semialdehyde 2,1-aminomutase
MRASGQEAMGSPLGLELSARACQVIPGGVNSATRAIGPPYAFVRANAQHVWDADGRRYLDYHAAFGAILLGHNDPGVNAAATRALGQVDLIGIGVTELEVRFAEKIVSVIPSAEMVVACTSGSEATHHAVRLARGVTGRRLIVKVQGGFHGWHDSVARNVISSPERAYRLDPISSGILPEILEATLVTEFNDLTSVERAFADHPGEIAAVILEPIPHNVGTMRPTPEYLHGLRHLTEAEGSVLIFDEVISGFRHALGGYQQVAGVRPDLTTFGKAVGNGFPISGLAGSRELMRGFSSAGGDVLLAGTFAGHPAGLGAALATIERLEESDFYARVFDLGDRMRAGLARVVGELGIAARVEGFGSVFVLYFLAGEVHGYRDLLKNDGAAYLEFHRRMTDRGFLMLPLALKRNHISASHTTQDVDSTLEAAEEVLSGMLRDGVIVPGDLLSSAPAEGSLVE